MLMIYDSGFPRMVEWSVRSFYLDRQRYALCSNTLLKVRPESFATQQGTKNVSRYFIKASIESSLGF